MILFLFFCSGATALVYEILWSKYLSLMFGSTIHAQTVVLAVFMGGLALGNRIFGRWADRARQPLAIYGYIEVAIGIYAFFFSGIYKVADGIFVSVGEKLLDQTGWLLLLKGVLSVALLLGPTILMGGTLPLLAAWLQKSSADAGRRSARFYSTNSLGAVFGAGLAGFFLVQFLGMPVSLQMTALVNVLVGVTAIGLARQHGNVSVSAGPGADQSVATTVNTPRVFRWGCLLVTLTGSVSMGLEVLASRCLTLIFGASLQAFAIVLMAFILGIGLGAAVIASPRRKHWPKERTTIVLLLSAAAFIGLIVFNIEQLVDFYRHARSGLGRTPMGYRYHQAIAAVMSIVVLGLPASALGAVLPLWIRVVAESSDLLGDRVGRLLTWNTLGAVGGVLLTGFVLMPNLGLRGSFGALAVVLSVAAMLIAWVTQKKLASLFAGAVAVALVLVSVTGGDGWRLVLSSGIFRRHEPEVYRDAMKERRRDVKILYYEDAADATVSIEQGDVGNNRNQIKLRINGKVDATSQGDLSTQYLLGHLPMMMRPDSKEIFVFGMGSGITAGSVLGHPVDHVTIAENCKPVLRASKFFSPWNNNVLNDPRTKIFPEDARTVLKLSPQKYDAIISEPSNPWMVGVGSVFSREFYELAAKRLNDGGLMVQWFHVYEMHDGIVALVLRTFNSVFPHVEIWDTGEGDLIMLGSARPWKSDAQAYQRIFEREKPRNELAQIGLKTPEAIWARQLASLRTGFAIAGEGPIQSDDFPVLEYEAPRAFYLGRMARQIFQFDERTWQAGIAPADKTASVSKLNEQDLREAFSRPTVNQELSQAMTARALQLHSLTNPVSFGPPPAIPCLFLNGQMGSEDAPANASAELKQLLQASAALKKQEANWLAQIKVIQDIIKRPSESASSNPVDWSRARFAGDAARACLNQRQFDLAAEMLALGLKSAPDNEELGYLARILERERPTGQTVSLSNQ